MLLPFVSSTPVSSPSNTVQRTSYGDLINALPNLLAALDFSNLDPPSHQKTGADRSQAKSALVYRSPDTGYGVPAAPVITSNAVEPSTGYGVPAAPPINYFAPASVDSYGAPQAAPIEDGYGSPAAPAAPGPAPAYEEPAPTYQRPLPVPSASSCPSPPPGYECSLKIVPKELCRQVPSIHGNGVHVTQCETQHETEQVIEPSASSCSIGIAPYGYECLFETSYEDKCETVFDEICEKEVCKQVPREVCSQIPNDVANIVETGKGCFVPCEDDASYESFFDPRYKPQDEDILKHPGIKRSQHPSAGFVIPQYTKRLTAFQNGQPPYRQLHPRIKQKPKRAVEEVDNTLHTLRAQASGGDEAECWTPLSCEDHYGFGDYDEQIESFFDPRYKPQDEVNLKHPGIKRNQHPSPGFAIPRSDKQLTPTQQAGRGPNPKIDQKPKGALEEVTDTLQKLGRQAYEWNVSMLSKISILFL